MDFANPADQKVKMKESEKIDQYLDFDRELKKQWNIRMTVIPIVISALGTIPKGLGERLEELEIRGRIVTGQNTEKSPGDLRRLAVIQTPIRNHQLKLTRKIVRNKIIIITLLGN